MKKILYILLVVICMAGIFPANASDDVNVAEGKPTSASTKYNDGTGPENITDGNDATYWSAGSISINGRKGGFDGWVGVDLGKGYNISRIVVKSRRDMDQESSRRSWVLQVSNDANYSSAKTIAKKKEAGAFGSDLDVTLEFSETYRYVRVCTEEYNIVIAEIEVYGSLPDTGDTFKKFDSEAEDIPGEANFLKKIGAMDGVDGLEFGADTLVKRSLAAKLILGLIGIEPSVATEKYYDDVEIGSPHSDSIAMCRRLGIISDGDMFYPDEYIKTAEFLKMAECAIGYGERIKSASSWETEVITIASELHLMKNCDSAFGGYVNRRNITYILFNTLFAKMMEVRYGSEMSVVRSESNLLESVYKMSLKSGIVNANSITSLISGAEYTSEGYVKISGKLLCDLSGEAEKLLGKNMKYIVDSEDNIQWCWEDKNNEIKINNEDITNASGKAVEYFEGEKKEKLRIKEGADFILNGSAYRGWIPSDLEDGEGYTIFTDNDNDGTYDVIFRYKPQILVTDFAFEEKDMFVITSKNGDKAEAKDFKTLEVIKDGKKSSVAGIKENSVVYCYISSNGRYVMADVQGKEITVTPESVEENGFFAGGTYYEFSGYYLKNFADTVILSKKLTFILNNADEIIWVEKGDIIAPQNDIAYIQKIAQADGINGAVQIRVYTIDGNFRILEFAEETKIDGKKYTADGIMNTLGENYFSGKFATYESRDGVIFTMDTETYKKTDEPDSKFYKTEHIFESGWRYFPGQGGIFKSNFMIFPLKNETKVFDIPLINGGNPAEDKVYDTEFKIRDCTSAFGNFADMNAIGVIGTAFYAADENGYPAFAVRYSSCSERTASVGSLAVKNTNAGAMIVSKVEKSYEGYNITGMALANGVETKISTDTEQMIETHKILTEKTEWINGYGLVNEALVEAEYISAIGKLKKGDIVRYEISGKTAIAVERIFDYSKIEKTGSFVSTNGSYYSTSREYPGYPRADFRLMLGKIKRLSDGIMTLDTTKQTLADEENPKYILDYSKISTLITFDGDSLKKEKPKNVSIYINKENSAVFFLSVAGNPRSLIVYEY